MKNQIKNQNQNKKWKRAKRKKERERKNKFFGINIHLKGRIIMITWSRHEMIGSDRSFKLVAKYLCMLSYSHRKKEETKAT